ncbi:hypothetical protein IW262DRAFT_1302643 [Armillaria fumosa]|nr:hypothetical protein IW262DRAFT_1302643 [Armillaria fumosa]
MLTSPPQSQREELSGDLNQFSNVDHRPTELDDSPVSGPAAPYWPRLNDGPGQDRRQIFSRNKDGPRHDPTLPGKECLVELHQAFKATSSRWNTARLGEASIWKDARFSSIHSITPTALHHRLFSANCPAHLGENLPSCTRVRRRWYRREMAHWHRENSELITYPRQMSHLLNMLGRRYRRWQTRSSMLCVDEQAEKIRPCAVRVISLRGTVGNDTV